MPSPFSKSSVRLVVIALLAGVLQAAPATMNLNWNQLSGVILNNRVIVDLKDGSSVKAVVVSVQAMALNVSVSSNAHPTYKRGAAAIPRERISSLRLQKMRKRGRIIGVTTGLVVGLVAGAMVGIAGGGNAAAAGAMVGTPVAGYFIGRSTDRQETLINVLPD